MSPEIQKMIESKTAAVVLTSTDDTLRSAEDAIRKYAPPVSGVPAVCRFFAKLFGKL